MSESLKINGVIKVINDTETFKGNFTKKTFVITTAGKYPQPVMFETIKDQTSLLDGLKVGDNVEVSFNIRGNEYNGKYYNNLQAWKINILNTEQLATDPAEPVGQTDGDDLPF